MKARDQMTLGTLRMLKSALTMKEVEKGRGLEPAEDLQVVASMVKQRRDSIEQFTKGNRLDLAERETQEIAILERFQPPAAGADEIAVSFATRNGRHAFDRRPPPHEDIRVGGKLGHHRGGRGLRHDQRDNGGTVPELHRLSSRRSASRVSRTLAPPDA